MLGVREAAALWHPPGAKDETPLVARSGARVHVPQARDVSGGALVGQTTAGAPREIRFPDDLLRRHHLYVARTRMGKSTLMQHLVAHRLREKAAGRDGDAIVVVDPHADLVADILQQVPESLAGQVRLLDLAGERGYPGINLLDTRVFSDRDRTADSVVRVAKGIWEQWGPRMQSILEQVVKTRHEHNAHPATAAEEQCTILDGLRLLSDDRFRTLVLKRVSDEFLLDWWERDFKGRRREYRADALAPVQTRLSYYASSKRARAILGQPRSTIDLRRTILDGACCSSPPRRARPGRTSPRSWVPPASTSRTPSSASRASCPRRNGAAHWRRLRALIRWLYESYRTGKTSDVRAFDRYFIKREDPADGARKFIPKNAMTVEALLGKLNLRP